eukprot:TRINITY_DN3368_c9_g1_i1.p1 TRINITY_DN3368_c9_g1~~TRINITY_DN3368_c9_g1_i1.p1  ORF type:complete len:823 (+),score=193.20 TRINITY_DN3368_c9_g1_i1:53-2470(+)
MVRTDVTSTELYGYVRREEYLKKGDEGWEEEARVETRKKAPLKEIENDPFDRQRVIPDFDQNIIERQVCLVLGTGGVGQNTALVLSRLGVEEIILVDKDTVDPSNLNRQCLSSKNDISKRKVDAAEENIKHHNIRSKISKYHIDVTANWQTVVQLASRSTFVFNCIDIGAGFDACVASLTKSLGKPLSVGQSYGWTYATELYSAQPTCPGAWDSPKYAAIPQMSPEEITLQDNLDFLSSIEGIKANTPTRYIGSWVVPCLGCATAMVGQMTSYLTSTVSGHNPQSMFTMDVGTGETQSESMLRSVTEMGPVDADTVASLVPQPQRVFDEVEPSPIVQKFAASVAELRSLLFVCGSPSLESQKAYFTPIDGTLVVPEKVIKSNQQEWKDILDKNGSLSVPETPNTALEGVGQVSDETFTLSPLIKTSSNEGTIKGFTSGIRSAMILQPNGCWYRLKGCGNASDGAFTIETHEGVQTPRGCSFMNTVLTEYFMTKKVIDLGIEVANHPIGYWKYAPKVDTSPGIDKYCGIFKTIGDRRAGDHLLAGIKKLCVEMLASSDVQKITNRIRADRNLNSDDDILHTDMMTACEMAVFSISDLELYEAVPKHKEGNTLWNLCCERLQRSLHQIKHEQSCPSLLFHIISRIGWECGNTLRLLHEGRVSWGTYKDSLGTHCNAHLNNLVVKDPKSNLPGDKSLLLAALDFDMSFTEDTYKPKTEWDFDSVLEFETKNGMRQVLSGSDFSSTGVANSVEVPSGYEPVLTAVHDTLVVSFDAAVGASSQNPHNPALDSVVEDVINLSLMLTADVVA